jgi:hypothetical protein
MYPRAANPNNENEAVSSVCPASPPLKRLRAMVVANAKGPKIPAYIRPMPSSGVARRLTLIHSNYQPVA